MNDEVVFEALEDEDVIPGLSNANALVHDPFAWDLEEVQD